MRPRRARLGCCLQDRRLWDQAQIASMRPRRARLGCCLSDSADTHAGRASMRPRRARLGCRAGPRRRSRRSCLQSRPRRARLGCCLGPTTIANQGSGFNEAEARAPRMLPSTTAAKRVVKAMLNEAEARAPRMLPCWPRGSYQRYAASRRGRGARASDAALLHQACLTDSGQTNEAEARAPRMLPCIRPSGCCPSYRGSRPRRARLGCCLQCHRLRPSLSRFRSRPRRARLGCCLAGLVDPFDLDVAASMRPRRARLGCCRSITAGHCPEFADTSMRPRRARLGC